MMKNKHTKSSRIKMKRNKMKCEQNGAHSHCAKQHFFFYFDGSIHKWDKLVNVAKKEETGTTHKSLVQEALSLTNSSLSFFQKKKERKMCQIQEEIEMHRVKLCIDLIIAINYNNQLENDGRIMPTVYKSGLN